MIIGGTYFLGRAFVTKLLAEKWKRPRGAEQIEIYLLNRGNMPKPEGVNGSFRLDRHDAEALKASALRGQSFDVIVDFCAYSAGDIESLVNDLSLTFKQYIFISTCDVYRHFEGAEQDESAALEERLYQGEEGVYIAGKVKLEEEVRRVCEEKTAHFTSIRPTIIYGPGNYAPREGIYFNWIQKSGQILQPFDATGHFQLVYVEDVADAILLLCGNQAAFDESYNVCGPKIYNYADFWKALRRAVPKKFHCVYMTVEEIIKKRIALPFPLTEGESEQYNDRKLVAMGLRYLSLEEGLRRSYAVFNGD